VRKRVLIAKRTRESKQQHLLLRYEMRDDDKKCPLSVVREEGEEGEGGKM
jgi:hypothetical protein